MTELQGWRRIHSCAAVLDAPRQPSLHFRFHPSYSSRSDAHPARESSFGFELVDHRAPEAGDFANLRQPQNLHRWDGCGRVGRHESKTIRGARVIRGPDRGENPPIPLQHAYESRRRVEVLGAFHLKRRIACGLVLSHIWLHELHGSYQGARHRRDQTRDRGGGRARDVVRVGVAETAARAGVTGRA